MQLTFTNSRANYMSGACLFDVFRLSYLIHSVIREKKVTGETYNRWNMEQTDAVCKYFIKLYPNPLGITEISERFKATDVHC